MRAIAQTSAKAWLVFVLSLVTWSGLAFDASDRYRSPRNPERKIRQSTRLIVLHTTEAPARSSLNKLSDRGEAHYCVTEEGSVYRIVDRDREAFHAGRSMWRGVEDVDKFSVGIECVGYHNKPMPTVQLIAIRDLVKELQAMYRLSDDKVVSHSQVAYGAPNKWQKRRHRGRKRCGMLFATATVRRILNLKTRVAVDPDTRSGRLSVGDDYLQKVLYGGLDPMAGAYGKGAVVAAAPAARSGGSWFSRLFGSGAKSAENPAPSSSRKPVVRSAQSPPKPSVAKTPVARAPVSKAPQEKPSSPTPPKAIVAASGSAPQSVAQLSDRGWVLKGVVSKSNSAIRIAGSKWNAPDTYYTIRDKVFPGNVVNPSRIEKGMGVWMKK